MRRRYSVHDFTPWLKKGREIGQQFIVPFCIFQAFRTLLFPTGFDVFLLGVFVLIALGYYFQWI
ncbi:hypothetical protein [Bacillus massiliglaciei]|uniref:hypothetical protein n=1 Tax=Bacillus massiliglaciei TaxID=1816693 RepID=UPI000DA62E5C|nr:hypothetical protein [Bacillus massiliglaciei]